MKNLTYSIEINASKKKVWDVMLQPDTYKEWTSVSWPGSHYEGKWAKDENIRFVTPGGGGTMANIIELKPREHILAEHVAVIDGNGAEDRSSDVAAGWIGTLEEYTFTERNGKTTLKVDIKTSPAWVDMFNEAGRPLWRI
jgi:uncharacterized protein YndB with AHSA1/START domain